MKFFNGKRGLAITYASFFSFFLFLSLPIGGVFYTLNDGNVFAKINEIISNNPDEISNAPAQFRLVFYFIVLMCFLTAFMFLLTAKSREIAFRFFSISFGIYTVVALGFKVILSAALTSEASKITDETLKADAPVAIKAFVNNYLIFGIIGAVLSAVALIIGLIPGRKKEF